MGYLIFGPIWIVAMGLYVMVKHPIGFFCYLAIGYILSIAILEKRGKKPDAIEKHLFAAIITMGVRVIGCAIYGLIAHIHLMDGFRLNC